MDNSTGSRYANSARGAPPQHEAEGGSGDACTRPLTDPVTAATIFFRWTEHEDYPDGRPAHRYGTLVHLRALLGFSQKKLDYWRESARPSRAAGRHDPDVRVFSADLLERKATFAALKVGPDLYDIWLAWDFKLDVLDYEDSEDVERKREQERLARRTARENELLKEHGEERNDKRSLAFVFFEEDSASPDLKRAQTKAERKKTS